MQWRRRDRNRSAAEQIIELAITDKRNREFIAHMSGARCEVKPISPTHWATGNCQRIPPKEDWSDSVTIKEKESRKEPDGGDEDEITVVIENSMSPAELQPIPKFSGEDISNGGNGQIQWVVGHRGRAL